MGSGLILLVIVGAWLAVLVPMGLRASDSAAPSRSAERLGGAVRVLRRRSAAAGPPDPAVESSAGLPATPRTGGSRRVVASRRQPARSAAWLSASLSAGWLCARSLSVRLLAGGRRLLRGSGLARAAAGRPGRARRSRTAARVTPAQRRRRVLLVLLVLTGVTTLAGLLGPAALLVVAVGLAALTVLWLSRCRSTAARARLRRRAVPERAAQLDAADRTVAVRISRAPEPVPAVPPAAYAESAAVHPEPAAAYAEPPAPYAEPRVPHRRPAAGQEWEPVPVPLPMYMGKAVAPRPSAPPIPTRRPRVELASLDDPGAVVADPAPTGEPRRAVGGW